MSHRRAVYAARFLRPPGWTKRLLLREKPREVTGPYENPVRRWVRLREKARQFSELPPPRQVPHPKPPRKKFLQAVEGVPRVDPKVLEKRLEFLLSPLAVQQQLAAPMRPGLTPFHVEFVAWERQLREVRRIYRAQYLQKLAEVTETERAREVEMFQRELAERKARKQAHMQRIGEDMKRRAILQDRKRIEAKVNEAIEMARRSKQKRRQLFWYRRMENLSRLIASSSNLDEALAAIPAEAFEVGPSDASSSGTSSSTGVFLSRNVSVPFLLRQLGGAKGFPMQKARRLPHVDNIQREILESSYEKLGEDEPRFVQAPDALSHRQRASQLYSVLDQKQKESLLAIKLDMLNKKIQNEEQAGRTDQVAIKLREVLEVARVAQQEGAMQAERKEQAKASRGEDPAGLPPLGGTVLGDNDPFVGGGGRSGPE